MPEILLALIILICIIRYCSYWVLGLSTHLDRFFTGKEQPRIQASPFRAFVTLVFSPLYLAAIGAACVMPTVDYISHATLASLLSDLSQYQPVICVGLVALLLTISIKPFRIKNIYIFTLSAIALVDVLLINCASFPDTAILYFTSNILLITLCLYLFCRILYRFLLQMIHNFLILKATLS